LAAEAAAPVMVGLGVWGVSVVWTGGVWEGGEVVVLMVLVVVFERNLGGSVVSQMPVR
jgi:hypothetical protein